MWVWDVTVCTKKRPESQLLGLWGPFIKLEWMVTFVEIFWLFSACTHMLKLGLTLLFFLDLAAFFLCWADSSFVFQMFTCVVPAKLARNTQAVLPVLWFFTLSLLNGFACSMLYFSFPPPLPPISHYNCISLIVAYGTNIRGTGRKN